MGSESPTASARLVGEAVTDRTTAEAMALPVDSADPPADLAAPTDSETPAILEALPGLPVVDLVVALPALQVPPDLLAARSDYSRKVPLIRI